MKKTIRKIALDLNIDEREVNKLYNLYWKFIRKEIEAFNIKGDFDEESFNNSPHYFNLQALGKLEIVVNRKIKEKYERYIQSKKSEGSLEPRAIDSKQI